MISFWPLNHLTIQMTVELLKMATSIGQFWSAQCCPIGPSLGFVSQTLTYTISHALIGSCILTLGIGVKPLSFRRRLTYICPELFWFPTALYFFAKSWPFCAPRFYSLVGAQRPALSQILWQILNVRNGSTFTSSD